MILMAKLLGHEIVTADELKAFELKITKQFEAQLAARHVKLLKIFAIVVLAAGSLIFIFLRK